MQYFCFAWEKEQEISRGATGGLETSGMFVELDTEGMKIFASHIRHAGNDKRSKEIVSACSKLEFRIEPGFDQRSLTSPSLQHLSDQLYK